jgi:hypothetical protein
VNGVEGTGWLFSTTNMPLTFITNSNTEDQAIGLNALSGFTATSSANSLSALSGMDIKLFTNTNIVSTNKLQLLVN